MIRLQKSDEIELRLDHLYSRVDYLETFRSIGLVNAVKKVVSLEIENLETKLKKLERYKNAEQI
ncbi:MAG: hypothetical protein CMM04_16745 [Rhodopirellula sp.]|nr:hypothetical protein [Rhodopirellula sp.]|tara:strand:+ start:5455 stop:5646 length:192 start_codon:yes stop_codon:yes gene_type:complete